MVDAGVISYSTNSNTSAVIRNLAQTDTLRILLETDAPYMVPSNLYSFLPKTLKGRLPLCHSGMLPWTAEFVAGIASEIDIAWDSTLR